MVLPNGGLPRKRGNPAAHDLTDARPDRRCGVMNRPRQGQPAMFPFARGTINMAMSMTVIFKVRYHALAAQVASAFM